MARQSLAEATLPVNAFATGIAAVHGKLDTVVRVWTLGVGIGYGRYPYSEGVWEGGHTVVSLDKNEKFCGCGGRGLNPPLVSLSQST